MRQARLSGLVKRRRDRTTIRVPGIETAPDLVERNSSPKDPNRLWTADITYIKTWQGFIYLATVVNCFSRRIVGWAIEDHLRAEIVVDALEMALSRRRVSPGLVHHSDQGSLYTALVFSRRCREASIDVSMGSKGDCFDNAVCESFHATIKKELPTEEAGRRSRRPARLSSSGSRSSTTASAATPRSATTRRQNTRGFQSRKNSKSSNCPGVHRTGGGPVLGATTSTTDYHSRSARLDSHDHGSRGWR